MTLSFEWQELPEEVWNNGIDNVTRVAATVLYNLLLQEAPKIENRMKQNAKWTDRTGNLRAGLAADVTTGFMVVHLILTMGRHPEGGFLEYAPYLEWAHGGKYAIIGPTIDAEAPRILERLREIFS